MKPPEAIRSDQARARPARLGALMFAIAALLVLALLGPLLMISGMPGMGEGSPLRQGLYFALFALVIYAVRPLEAPQRLLAVPLPIVVALIWCWMSIFWAIDPGIAFRRVILTTSIIWMVFMAVEQAGYRRSIFLFRGALVFALVLNYLVVFGLPEIGVHQSNEMYDQALTGDWRGMLVHKNFAGLVCAVTIIAFAFDADRVSKYLRIAVVAGAAFFLYRTFSKTSAGVCLAGLLAGALYMRYSARYRVVILAGASLLAIALPIAYNIFVEQTMQSVMTNKDAFTGRTQIWNALLSYSEDHRILGAGFDSFWNIGANSPIYHYGRDWVVLVGGGHNGFLDLLVQIGLPGLLLVVLATIVVPLVRMFSSPAAIGPGGALIFALLLFCVAHNSTESSLFDRDLIGEVFLMFTIALLWTVTSADAVRTGSRPTAGTGRKLSFRELLAAR